MLQEDRTEWGLMDKSLLLDSDNGGDKMAKLEKKHGYIKGENVDEYGYKQFQIISEPKEGGDYEKVECQINAIQGKTKEKWVWSMTDIVRNQLIEAYGSDSTEWIGKTLEVYTEETKNGKKTIKLFKEQF